MLKLTKIDELRGEIDNLNKQRELIPLDSKAWKANKKRADKLLKEIIGLKDTNRRIPLMRAIGTELFHILTRADIEKIWEITGVKRTLVRCNNMPTAKFSFKRTTDKIVVYLDVRPCGIYYSTKIV